MAGSQVIGLGAGTIILLVLWTVTAFIWVVLHRTQSALRYIVTLIASVTTLTLFLLPPETNEDIHPPRYSREEEIVRIFFCFLHFIPVLMQYKKCEVCNTLFCNRY
jgi:hypothetical protein